MGFSLTRRARLLWLRPGQDRGALFAWRIDICIFMHKIRNLMHADRPQSDRRDNILRHLRAGAVRRQSDLVEAAEEGRLRRHAVLGEPGHARTGRAQGAGALPAAGEEVSQAQGNFSAIDRFVRDIRTAGPSITVIRTSVGAAGSVAVAIDKAAWPEAVGTISGDDTIFIATQDGRAQAALLERLRSVFRI